MACPTGKQIQKALKAALEANAGSDKVIDGGELTAALSAAYPAAYAQSTGCDYSFFTVEQIKAAAGKLAWSISDRDIQEIAMSTMPSEKPKQYSALG